MFHYLFTNDLRISKLDASLVEASRCFIDDCVPSATEDKNANNNMNTLGFYFNLLKNSNCAKECKKGNIRKVVLNFIKKFQFPNPRTQASLNDCINDNIQIAPMRVIVQILYMMLMKSKKDAFLTKKEIAEFVFFNDDVAKTSDPDIYSVVNEIISKRIPDDESKIPDDEELKKRGCYWNQCERQIREMVKVLCWSGCVMEEDNGNIRIHHNNLSRDNKADLFEILTFNEMWLPSSSIDIDTQKVSYQKYMDLEDEKYPPSLTFTTSHHSDAFPLNRIIFGAPGTGKSYRLDKEKETLIGSANDIDYERVTFHPDYTYAHFVGTYKPVPEKDATGAETITYKYVPGPFMRILVKALKNAMESEDRHRPFLLIIEEINRANVAAVFGDIFQLLDRGDDGVSEYPIEASEDMKAYLARELGVEIDACSKIKLPNNLYIWATMNSADQGVFPMDTAFKRRWEFTYIGIDENEAGIAGKMVELPVRLKGAKGQLFEWNELRKEINRFLIGKGVNEDKLLGPYFIKLDFEKDASGVIDPNRIDPIKFSQTFKDKVIMYLFEDVKKGREELFNGYSELSKLYSTISRGFDEQGLGIFNGEIHAKVFPSDLP